MKSFRLLFALLLVAFLAMPVMAGDSPALKNYEIVSGNGGAEGISPMTKVVKVRYGYMLKASPSTEGNISSGDVLSWDMVSCDGITVSKCMVTKGGGYAGVAVTDILTADSATVKQSDRNWGYMAIKGYCLAKTDASTSTPGQALAINGSTLYASFGTVDLAGSMPGSASQDIGVLLSDSGSDGLNPVILK